MNLVEVKVPKDAGVCGVMGGVVGIFFGLVFFLTGRQWTSWMSYGDNPYYAVQWFSTGFILLVSSVVMLIAGSIMLKELSYRWIATLTFSGAVALAFGMKPSAYMLVGWIPGILGLVGGLTGFQKVSSAPAFTCHKCASTFKEKFKYCPNCGTQIR